MKKTVIHLSKIHILLCLIFIIKSQSISMKNLKVIFIDNFNDCVNQNKTWQIVKGYARCVQECEDYEISNGYVCISPGEKGGYCKKRLKKSDICSRGLVCNTSSLCEKEDKKKKKEN